MTRLRIEKRSMKKKSKLNDVMKLVKNYENVQQKTVTLFDKLFIIDNNDINRFFITNRKKKSKRFSKTLTIIASSIFVSKKNQNVHRNYRRQFSSH